MTITVLSVAYPLAAVSPDATGGAEQVLSHLDNALVKTGHRSIVVAREGSRVAGDLIATPAVAGALDAMAIATVQARYRAVIAAALERESIDVVHMHGVDFHAYLPADPVPVLATLHLPLDWYPADIFHPRRPATWLNCVSAAQQASCPAASCLLAPIENGIPVDLLAMRRVNRKFALVLARICPEKGIHLAIAAAKRARAPLLIAGDICLYADHQRYFDHELKPRLDRRRRYIGPVGFARKCRLLGSARCLIVSSLVPETSSLAAKEALAAGTPVVAFGKGALPDVIEHGRTGFLVSNETEMAEAILAADTIDPAACRTAAEKRFRLEPKIANYFAAYEMLARTKRHGQRVEAAA